MTQSLPGTVRYPSCAAPPVGHVREQGVEVGGVGNCWGGGGVAGGGEGEVGRGWGKGGWLCKRASLPRTHIVNRGSAL